MEKTLGEFVQALRNSDVRVSTSETIDAINMFGRWWEVQRKYQADRYPIEMNVAEWDEQFMAWLSSEEARYSELDQS